MIDDDVLARQFEQHRDNLRAVAYRMLGSAAEAEDAVQEAWLKLSRSGADGVANLGGWLTTVVGRVCLDMLRSRKSRREEPMGEVTPPDEVVDPEREAMLADSVGLALLVVLDQLEPAERLAFVLHDVFAVPFDEIAPIVDRTPTAARKLASRARSRVRGGAEAPVPDLVRQRTVVDAFISAARGGDIGELITLLDPDVVLRVDAAAGGTAQLVRGAHEVAGRAAMYSARGPFARAALIDGSVGVVVAPRGKLLVVMTVVLRDDKITELEIIGDPARWDELELAVLD